MSAMLCVVRGALGLALGGGGGEIPELDQALRVLHDGEWDRSIEELLREPPPELVGEELYAWVDHRGGFCGQFRQSVRTRADQVLPAAARVLQEGKAADRRRAQLLLAQVKDLPDWLLREIEAAPTFDSWALAQLRRRRRADYLLDASEWKSHFSWAHTDGWEAQVAPQLVPRIALTPEELERCNEEYIPDYQRIALPILQDYAEHLDYENRCVVDLDGDGSPEIVIHHRIDTGWDDRMHYVAVARLQGGRWVITDFERLAGERFVDILVRDFDRDGDAEVALRTGTLGAAYLRLIDADDRVPWPRLGSDHAGVVLLERDLAGPTRFFTGELYTPSQVGTWGVALGAMAILRQAHTWTGHEFAPAEPVLEPLQL